MSTVTFSPRVEPAAPESPAPTPTRVPWTYRDMVKAILAVVVGSVIANAIAYAIADSFLEAGQDFEDNASAFTAILISSLVVQEILLLGAVLWFTARKYNTPLATLGLRKPEHGAWWFAGSLAVAGLALIYGYIGVLYLMGIEVDALPDQYFDHAGPAIVVVIGAVLMAPVIEEMLFRGFLFGGLQGRWGWAWAAIATGVLFGLAHLAPAVILPFAAVGILFAWSYHYTGSLRPGIIAHFTLNAVSVGLGLLASG